MGLDEYHRKRDFQRTPEPRGRKGARTSGKELTGRFVVQKHAARRLHYDFRLELDGVLKSWAVPKGPSLAAGERRMAVETEDHPLEYAGFEGVIPQGEYGGGTVVVWDRGYWRPIGDARQGLARGKLDFVLEGDKLRGRWHLVRLRARPSDRGRTSWLLMKGSDAEARTGAASAITEVAPRSVLTGRDLETVKRQRDRVWSSERGELEIAGVHLSTPGRVYFPDVGITKRELAAYYVAMAERVLPGLLHRPLTLLRCPEGQNGECFYQKRADRTVPELVGRVMVREGRAPYAMVTGLASLVALVQIGVLELHVWGARADRLDRPDLLVFDLDPDPSVEWPKLVETALVMREYLAKLGLIAFVRMTGGKGVHLVSPIVRRSSWDEVKMFSFAIARGMVGLAPDRFTASMSKARRTGKIFIDTFRNAPEATAIASYSVRARPGAPVALPISWEELAALDSPLRIDPRGAVARLSKPDPWADFEASRRPITRDALRGLI